jgi:hypothetical protein
MAAHDVERFLRERHPHGGCVCAFVRQAVGRAVLGAG